MVDWNAAPGFTAPTFALQTPQGEEVSLEARLLVGPVLLEFIRGTWDPDARSRLVALAGLQRHLLERRTGILVIACEAPRTMAGYLADRPSPLTLLSDPERRVARSYGVLKRFSLPVWNVARPASFLIDRCGFVRYAYRARLSIHAAPTEEILQALEHL